MAKFYYIYNPHQANYFYMNDVPIVEIGKGGKGDTYVKFPRNEYSEKVFAKWIDRCKLMRSKK